MYYLRKKCIIKNVFQANYLDSENFVFKNTVLKQYNFFSLSKTEI